MCLPLLQDKHELIPKYLILLQVKSFLLSVAEDIQIYNLSALGWQPFKTSQGLPLNQKRLANPNYRMLINKG